MLRRVVQRPPRRLNSSGVRNRSRFRSRNFITSRHGLLAGIVDEMSEYVGELDWKRKMVFNRDWGRRHPESREAWEIARFGATFRAEQHRQAPQRPRAGAPTLTRLHRLGRRQDPVKEEAMYWWITHDPADDTPSPDYAVPARSHEAAKRKLAAAINVPLWTLR